MVLGKVALTGASGMLGRHVLAALAARGIEALCSSRSRPMNLPASGRWSPWDLAEWKEPGELDALFPGADALIHVGAAVPSTVSGQTNNTMFDANVRACLALGQWAAARNMPVVFVSGAIVYADTQTRGITEQARTTHRGAGGLYGSSKLLGENVFEHYRGAGLALCVLRPSSIYGSGLPAEKMISKFLRLAADGEEIALSPPTGDRVNLVHAADVAQAVLASLKRGAWGCFNIAASSHYSIREIAEGCVQVSGSGSVSGPAADGTGVIRYDLDCGAARKQLGFEGSIALSRGLEMIRDEQLLDHG